MISRVHILAFVRQGQYYDMMPTAGPVLPARSADSLAFDSLGRAC